MARASFDLLNLGIMGFSSHTNRKEGRKIPNVAASAPVTPFICQPIKVAVDNTGPGVICPIATASIITCLLSQPLATNSVSKNAKSTYPLPYRMAPTFKKDKNILNELMVLGVTI